MDTASWTLLFQALTLVVTGFWLWVTYRSLSASREAVGAARDANGEAQEANRLAQVAITDAREATGEANRIARDAVAEARQSTELARRALVQQARLEAYPALYVAAEESASGEALTVSIHALGRAASGIRGIVLAYDSNTYLDPEGEPVEEERYDLVASFDLATVSPGLCYTASMRPGGRSVGKALVLQYTDVLGEDYTDLYEFGQSGESGGPLPLWGKRPTSVLPVPRWAVGTSGDGSHRAVAEVVDESSDLREILPPALVRTLAEVTPFRLAMHSVFVEIGDGPGHFPPPGPGRRH